MGTHNLPRQITPFVGRKGELAEITRLLSEPGCHLLTLVGPGGIGKTRLAIEAAGNLVDQFSDGVYFVPFQPVQSADFLASTIADALDFSLTGQQEPGAQLCDYLGRKEILLLLDNFEHLLDGADLALELLQAAPNLKLLVTSREVLSLQEEWLYPVGGLPYPGAGQTEPTEMYSAVELFVGRAQRVRPDFSPEDEHESVVRICQLVEGTPLALELAASWVKSLSCADIAAEIQRNLDFLATRVRDVPQRHQSMQAVFNQSWERLSQKEREAFKRLAVFRGGFRREAAEQVAGASLAILTTLVDKSLLRWEADGRYQIHELLRQYAAEQLAYSPEDVAQVYDRHCAYYARFLDERATDMAGGRQKEATLEIEADLENIRATWEWAVDQLQLDALQKSVMSFGLFCQYRSRFLDGRLSGEQAVRRLKEAPQSEARDRLLVHVLVHLAWFSIRQGRLAEAEEALAECELLYRQLGILPVLGDSTDPALASSILASIRGDYGTARRLGEQSLETSEIQNNVWNRKTAYYVLTRATLLQGDYEAAYQYARQGYTLTEETGDRWFLAYCLNELGNVVGALGDYATARQHYRASYEIRQELNDPEGMAAALNQLGEIALVEEDFAEARQLYEQSTIAYQKILDKGGQAAALAGLGNAAVGMGDYEAARQQFQQALHLAVEINFVTLILSMLIGIGKLLIRTGRKSQGLQLLIFVANHPASDHETKTRAQEMLTHHQENIAPDLSATAGQNDLEAVLQTVQIELAAPIDIGESHVSGSSEKQLPAGAQDLVEPLTARELEVVRLIAEGLSNPEIAEALVLAVGTVKYYTAEIYGKLGVRNRVEAVARARELGLL